ncbi:uncharacterized protein LOC106703625 [Latimeria chalumnae]|uniref:uncharacterized protein LOC106703625 n=1 Tax=Latimeria chalumnae TaxID=7897 RepID=UPI00313DB1EF
MLLEMRSNSGPQRTCKTHTGKKGLKKISSGKNQPINVSVRCITRKQLDDLLHKAASKHIKADKICTQPFKDEHHHEPQNLQLSDECAKPDLQLSCDECATQDTQSINPVNEHVPQNKLAHQERKTDGNTHKQQSFCRTKSIRGSKFDQRSLNSDKEHRIIRGENLKVRIQSHNMEMKEQLSSFATIFSRLAEKKQKQKEVNKQLLACMQQAKTTTTQANKLQEMVSDMWSNKPSPTPPPEILDAEEKLSNAWMLLQSMKSAPRREHLDPNVKDDQQSKINLMTDVDMNVNMMS